MEPHLNGPLREGGMKGSFRARVDDTNKNGSEIFVHKDKSLKLTKYMDKIHYIRRIFIT